MTHWQAMKPTTLFQESEFHGSTLSTEKLAVISDTGVWLLAILAPVPHDKAQNHLLNSF